MATALRHGAFRRLAALYTAGALFEWFGSVALMVVVYDATDSPAVAAAMLFCKQVAPAFLVASVSERLDSIPYRAALAATVACQSAVFAVLAATGYGLALFPLAIVAGAGSALNRGLIRAGVARVLEGEVLRQGNAALNLVACVVFPLAPLIAAGSIAAAGPSAALAVAAAVFAVLTLTSFAAPRADCQDDLLPSSAEASGVEADGQDAVSTVPIAWLLLLAGASTAIAVIDEPSLLAYARDSLGAGIGGYGAIFGAQAVGLALGSVVFTRLLGWSMLRIYSVATILLGVGMLGMGVSSSLTMTCAFAAISGIGIGMDWVALVTAVQEATPRGQEARTTTRLEAAGMVGPGVGIALGGLLAEVGSPRLALVVTGLLAFVVLATLALALRLRQRPSSLTTERLVLSASIPGGSA